MEFMLVGLIGYIAGSVVGNTHLKMPSAWMVVTTKYPPRL